MILKQLSSLFAVAKLEAHAELPIWATRATLFFIARTSDELSIMCPQANMPASVNASRDWVCFRVDGDLAFEQVGVVATVSSPIANNGISLFLMSTHDRDYILIHQDTAKQAINIYQAHGFTIISEPDC